MGNSPKDKRHSCAKGKCLGGSVPYEGASRPNTKKKTPPPTKPKNKQHPSTPPETNPHPTPPENRPKRGGRHPGEHNPPPQPTIPKGQKDSSPIVREGGRKNRMTLSDSVKCFGETRAADQKRGQIHRKNFMCVAQAGNKIGYGRKGAWVTVIRPLDTTSKGLAKVCGF